MYFIIKIMNAFIATFLLLYIFILNIIYLLLSKKKLCY